MTWAPRELRPSHAPRIASIVALVEGCRLLYLLTLTDARLVQYLPDDAFYYMQAARNFAALHRWTFDRVEPSSGFHLLWGYLLALALAIRPEATIRELLLWGGLLQSVCLAAAAFLVTKTAERVGGRYAGGGVLLIFLSAISLMQATWMMESCFVLLAAAATLFLLARLDQRTTSRNFAAAFTVGLFTTLSRSDSGLLAVFYFVAHFFLWLFAKGARSMLLASSWVLAGVASGVIVVTLHTHWVSGLWFQASALEKVFWTRTLGASFVRPLHLVYDLFDPLFNATAKYTPARLLLEQRMHAVQHLLPAAVLLATVVWVCVIRGVRARLVALTPGARVVLLVPVATILAYLFTDRLVSAAANLWYVANFEVPVAMLVGVGMASFIERHVRTSAILLTPLCLSGVLCSFVTPFPWQEGLWRAGVYLHQHPSDHPVGSWNAGIIAFTSNRDVVNLDGLMNDRVVPYTINGNLRKYLAQRGMDTVIDSLQIWDDSPSATGGYANGELKRCIVARQDLFPDDPSSVVANHVHKYTLNPACVSQAAASP